MRAERRCAQRELFIPPSAQVRSTAPPLESGAACMWYLLPNLLAHTTVVQYGLDVHVRCVGL